ncbi:MAG: hypothetical protein KC445_04115 [Anaerolineales bacterium]|nr:hypothetical protein [Anaerolineales bacterium]
MQSPTIPQNRQMPSYAIRFALGLLLTLTLLLLVTAVFPIFGQIFAGTAVYAAKSQKSLGQAHT